MSKSRGNILYPEHLIERGYHPSFIRFHLICERYRNRLDLTEENLRMLVSIKKSGAFDGGDGEKLSRTLAGINRVLLLDMQPGISHYCPSVCTPQDSLP